MDDHPLAVNIPHLQVDPLLQPQPTAVYRAQAHLVAHDLHAGQEQTHLIDGEDDRQLFLARRTHHLNGRPLPLQGIHVEKLGLAQDHRQRAGRDTFLVEQVEKVGAQFCFGNLIGGFMIVLDFS